MRLWPLVPLSIVLSLPLACTSAATRNLTNIQRLRLDMSRAQVVAVMGAPEGVEAARLEDGTSLEVLYYITENPPGPTPWSKRLCTPLVIVAGKLIGWGTDFWENEQQARSLHVDLEVKRTGGVLPRP